MSPKRLSRLSLLLLPLCLKLLPLLSLLLLRLKLVLLAPPATASDQAQSHPTTPTTAASQAPPTAPPQAPSTAVANKQPKRRSKDTDDPMSTFEGDLTPQSSPAPKRAK
ncbi:hypothetical protein JOM56_015360 [Amanita muscaria]